MRRKRQRPAPRPQAIGDHRNGDPAEPGREGVRQPLRLLVAAHPAVLAPHALAGVAETAVRVLKREQRRQHGTQPALDVGAPVVDGKVRVDQEVDEIDVDAGAVDPGRLRQRPVGRPVVERQRPAGRVPEVEVVHRAGHRVQRAQRVGQLPHAPETGGGLLQPVVPVEQDRQAGLHAFPRRLRRPARASSSRKLPRLTMLLPSCQGSRRSRSASHAFSTRGSSQGRTKSSTGGVAGASISSAPSE